MAKGYTPEFMQELKAKNNIIDVVASYVALDRKGDNHWACCPFHHERTPSFSVSESGQFYHCFGCGVSGDVVKFVEEIESVDFADAVKILAVRAGMPLPETNFDDERALSIKKKRDTLLKIMKDAAHFYLDNLNGGRADAHIDYILERKLSSATVRRFGLGASLNFTDLPKYLLEKGYRREDLLDSGIVMESKGRLLDAQGGRLIYPIINAFDEVIAFGGRILEKKADFAKYKNTKETLIFNKSQTLYNVNLLKKQKKERGLSSVIVVEGYMDTISLYQAGFKNVVASMGTSLTQGQARMLKRYSDNVLISYDGDFAGQKGAIRGLEILKDEQLNVKVVALPEGLDPDDVCKQRGPEGYQVCLDNAMPLIDFKIDILERKLDLSKTEERRQYIAEALKVIRSAESAAEREELLKRLREKTGITYESLKQDLEGLAAPTKAGETPVRVKEDGADRVRKAARFVLAAVLFSKRYTENFVLESVVFEDRVHERVADFLFDCKDRGEKPRPSDLFYEFEEDEPELNAILDLNNGTSLEGERGEKFFFDSVRALKRHETDKQMKKLAAAFSQSTDVEERKLIALQLQELAKTLKNQ